MLFTDEKNKITIVAEERDEKHIEIEELRKQKTRNDELEKKLALVMQQLGMTE